MRKLSIGAAIAAVTAIAGVSVIDAQPAQAAYQECHQDMTKEGAPLPEDNCDVVGDPEEGGTGSPSDPNAPPPPPPPPPPVPIS